MLEVKRKICLIFEGASIFLRSANVEYLQIPSRPFVALLNGDNLPLGTNY